VATVFYREPAAEAKVGFAMANHLKEERKLAVLHHLIEGIANRSPERLTGVHRDTIMRLLVRTGNRCREFLDTIMCNLRVEHLEIDEIWTFVAKKQKRVRVQERYSQAVRDVCLWIALDQRTKLIPSFILGKRTADMARRFLLDLASRVRRPTPHESDDHAYQRGSYSQDLQLSTDGFAAYPEAVDLAFAPYVKYGQIIKDYRNAHRPPGNYSPAEMIATERRRIFGDVELPTICTSHVERNNLTIRTFIRRFTRLSLGFSKKLENLAAAVALYVAYFNFCWRPRKPGKSGQKRATPAMAAGVTDRLWSFEDLYERIFDGKYPADAV